MKTVLRVSDMMCPNCAMHLEGLEDEVPGIKKVVASYKKLTMEVEYDEKVLTLEQIIHAGQR